MDEEESIHDIVERLTKENQNTSEGFILNQMENEFNNHVCNDCSSNVEEHYEDFEYTQPKYDIDENEYVKQHRNEFTPFPINYEDGWSNNLQNLYLKNEYDDDAENMIYFARGIDQHPELFKTIQKIYEITERPQKQKELISSFINRLFHYFTRRTVDNLHNRYSVYNCSYLDIFIQRMIRGDVVLTMDIFKTSQNTTSMRLFPIIEVLYILYYIIFKNERVLLFQNLPNYTLPVDGNGNTILHTCHIRLLKFVLFLRKRLHLNIYNMNLDNQTPLKYRLHSVAYDESERLKIVQYVSIVFDSFK